MELKKNSFKKNKRNVYKVDLKSSANGFINKIKGDKEKKQRKDNFFDRINLSFLLRCNNILIPVVVSLILIIGIAYAGIEGYRYIIKGDNFLLTEITVNGEQYLTKDEVITLSGLQKNSNILNYEIAEIEANLLKSDWIQDVRIKRTLPSKFNIEIQERKPIFLIINNDELYYLDNKAKYIARVEKEKFISLPVLYINNAGINEINMLPSFINELETTKFPYALTDISWVNINPMNGFELFVEAQNLILQIDKQNYEENIKNLVSALDDLKKRKEISKVRKIKSAFNKVMIIKD